MSGGWQYSAKVVPALVARGMLAETTTKLHAAACEYSHNPIVDRADDLAYTRELAEAELRSFGRAIPRAVRFVDALVFNAMYDRVAGAMRSHHQISEETLTCGGFLSGDTFVTSIEGAQEVADAIVAAALT